MRIHSNSSTLVHPSMAQLAPVSVLYCDVSDAESKDPDIHIEILHIRLEFISLQDMKLEHVNYFISRHCDRSFSVLLLSLKHV